MRLRTSQLLLACLLLLGCGSGSNNGNQDAAEPRIYPEVTPPTVETGPADLVVPVGPVDADSVPTSTCNEDAMGEHFCIVNPGTNVGGGTVVARIQPTMDPFTCK
jgi:hypothetical protein